MTRTTSLLTLAATALLSCNVFAAPVTQYVKLTVTENSNVTVQQQISFQFAFSSNGTNALDAYDMGNPASLTSMGDNAYPFSLSSNNDRITMVDSRPDLNSTQKIQMGFASKFPAQIKIVASVFNSINDPYSNLPGYVWIQQISTGYTYQLVKGDTVKLEIPANIDFSSADFYICTGPAISKSETDETCFGSFNGMVSVSNPNMNSWNLTIYKNSSLFLTTTVNQPDTTIQNLTAANYMVITTSDSFNVDTAVLTVSSPPQIIADFMINNYYPLENDTVTFTNNTSGAVSYAWDFGDGNTDTVANAAHAYSFYGSYQVVLTATNEFGCQNVVFDSVFVQPAPSNPSTTMHQGPSFQPTMHNSNFSGAPSSFDPTATAPSSTWRTIDVHQGDNVQQMSVTVLSMNGQLISTTSTSNELLEVPVPQPGVYIVKMVSTKGELKTDKVLITQ